MAGSSGTNLIEVTDSNFEAEVLESSTPFLVDLSAEWCGPCKALAPVIEALAGEYDGRVRFGTLDIDSNPEVPTRYQVRSVPTLILFQGGEVVGQLIGAHPRPRLVELIEKVI